MVSTSELMNKIQEKSNVTTNHSRPKPRFKPLSAQRGLSEMFKPQHLNDEVDIKKNSIDSVQNFLNQDNIEQNEVELKNREIEIYKKKIEELEGKLLLKRSKNGHNTANEIKVLNAIRSEVLIQNRENPVISRNMFIKKYNINVKYFDNAVEQLILKNQIEKIEVKYSIKVITFAWRILDQHN